MHTLLGLGWDEWGSIVAIVASICVLANWILNKTVRIPLNNLGKRLSLFTDGQITSLIRTSPKTFNGSLLMMDF
ncbi:hypothetical protein EFS29_12950 [Lactiplantibacillus plantarum]|nr:hypothetical protein [Lactiplantibacillus plantarum]